MDLSLFHEWLRTRYRPSTVPLYLRHVRGFMDWLQRRGLALEQLTPESLMEYKLTLDQRGVERQRPYLYAIRSLLEYKGLRHIAEQVPIPSEHVVRQPTWLPEPLIHLLIEKMEFFPRLQALAALSYDLALRINEAIPMLRTPGVPNEPWVDLANLRAQVRREKTRRYPLQILPLSPWAAKYIQRYLDERDDDDPHLFVTKSEASRDWRGPPERPVRPLSFKTAEGDWNATMKLFRLPFRFHFLKHSRLTNMALAGRPIAEMQDFVLHTNPTSTLVYIHAASLYRTRPESILEYFKHSWLLPEAEGVLRASLSGRASTSP